MSTINASDIQALGRKIATMMANRKNTVEGGIFLSTETTSGNGPVQLSGDGVYATDGTTTTGTLIDKATYNKTIGVLGTMGAIKDNTNLTVPSTVATGTKIITQAQYDSAVDWVNAFYNKTATTTGSGYTLANKQAASGCQAFCTGLCLGTCYSSSNGSQGTSGPYTYDPSAGISDPSSHGSDGTIGTPGASNYGGEGSGCNCSGCTSICSGGCTGQCSGGCGGTATSCSSCAAAAAGATCQYSCTGCGSYCANGCGAQCASYCGSACTGGCGGGCIGQCTGCSGGCAGGCKTGCTGCYSDCTGGCGSNCIGQCGNGCTGCTGCSGCYGQCTGCSDTCDNCHGCGSGCATDCTGYCGSTCSGCTGSCSQGCSNACKFSNN